MKHLRYLLMAALVAMPLTACDEDDDPVIEPEIFGTVTGTVSADGTGLSGVGVTLVGATSQSATTGAGGTYTFTNVEAGSYGISIDASTHPDVSFSQTAKTTTISTDGQTATVDFSGSYIRTSSITGVVVAGGAAVGATVNLTGGPESVSKTTGTGAGGAYAFTGLRAGDYNVAITDVEAGYNFTTTQYDVSVGVGESYSLNFNGTAIELATISGAVTVDGVGAVGVVVTLSGGADATTETGAGGAYSFTNLTPGEYTVTITPPEDAEFPALAKTLTVGPGATGVASFAGTGPFEPATISIKSITRNDDGSIIPVDLDNVFDQIEITLNITRNDDVLDYVDIVFENRTSGERVIMATQVFGVQDSPAEMIGETEETVLSIQTTQLKPGTTPTLDGARVAWVPAAVNGAWEVGALLAVEREVQPIPSDKKPIVLQNPDMLLAGTAFGGDIEFFPSEPDRTAIGDDGDDWYAGGGTAQGWQWLSYTTVLAEDFAFDLEWDGDGYENFSDSIAVVGNAADGVILKSFWFEDGELFIEEDDVYVVWDMIYDVEYPDDVVGPDGTPLFYYGQDGECGINGDGGGCIATIGAEYFLSDPDEPIGPRRYIIHPEDVQDGQVIEPDEINFDNVAPWVWVDGESGEPAFDELVAFKDEFDQPWVNADYTFLLYDEDDDEYLEEGDVYAQDGGVGLDDALTSALWYDWNDTFDDTSDDVCTDVVLVTGDDLDESQASDGTPDGYRICATATDKLANTAKSGPSNYFGVDKTDPSIRAYDEDGAGGGEISPDLDADVDGVIFSDDPLGNGEYSSYDTNWYWAFEALDDRSGFDTNYFYDDLPAMQSLTHYGFVPLNASPIVCDQFDNTLNFIAPGNQWVRTVVVDFTCLPAFGGNLDEPGYFWYDNMVTDRAGNTATLGQALYAVDDLNSPNDASDPPTFDLLSPASTFYTPGEPADFDIWATDDLEVIEAALTLTYPGVLFDFAVNYGFGQIDAYERFDGIDPFDASLFTSSVVGQPVATPLPLFGRLDLVCVDGAGTPYAECLEADGVTTDSTEYDLGGDPVDMLPYEATGSVQDVGFNRTAFGSSINFIPAQFDTAAAAPWSALAPGTSEVIIRRWYIQEETAGSEYTAVMEAPTSIEVPYFDAVALVHNDGADPANITVCGTFTYDGDTDNGVDRFFNYSATIGDDTPCDGLLGGTFHAVGFKLPFWAGLVTLGIAAPAP